MKDPILSLAAMAVAAPVLARTMTPGQSVAAAGAGDLYERTSSELVMKSTRDPRIRLFAKMAVTDHAKSAAGIKAVAVKSRAAATPLGSIRRGAA